MTNNDENIYDGFDTGPGDGPGKKRSGSRTFLVAITILGVVFVIFVVAMVLVVPMIQKSRTAGYIEQAALINAQNTATSMAAMQMVLTLEAERKFNVTALAAADTRPTPTPVLVIATETPASKMLASSPEAGVGAEASGGINRTATIAALITQAAASSSGGINSTHVADPIATALPNTGFIDEIGLPGMIGMAVVLFAVVIFVRRFRLPETK
jgi:hypothetical protein